MSAGRDETFEVLQLAPEAWGRAWFHGEQARWQRRVHRHAELEVNLVVAGRASYLVDEARYDLGRGTVIWLHPGQDHVLVNDTPDYQMWLGVWRPTAVSAVCRGDGSRGLTLDRPAGLFCKVLPEGAVEELERLWSRVVGSAEAVDRYNAGLAHLLMECWAAFESVGSAGAGGGAGVHPAVERAARLLRDEADPVGIDAIAEHAGLSPSQLSRVFKRQMGLSITEYRQRQCLQRFFAAWGSGGGRLDTMGAALAAGFGSYPQFHRVFKRHMGCGPAEHRRRTMRERESSILPAAGV